MIARVWCVCACALGTRVIKCMSQVWFPCVCVCVRSRLWLEAIIIIITRHAPRLRPRACAPWHLLSFFGF